MVNRPNAVVPAMKLIPLTQGQFAMVDDADFEQVSQHKWCAVKSCRTFYATRYVYLSKGRYGSEYLHHFILRHRLMTDHKDRNGLNNQRENLRPATHVQNAYNKVKHCDNTSGFIGVFKSNSRSWRARINNGHGGLIHLGTYQTKEEAARAYDVACRALHKEFANTNFPDEVRL